MIENERGVYLQEDTHQYFDRNGMEYTSVSRFLNFFEEQFNAETMAPHSARKQLREAGNHTPTQKQVDETAYSLKTSWRKSGDYSINEGNRIHKPLEIYSKTTRIDPEFKDLEPMIRGVHNLFTEYKVTLAEQVVYLSDAMLAGTIDKPCFVSDKYGCMVDVHDYKTNAIKGIQYYNKYKTYMKHCVSHLQQCNYNRYCLQVSVYAYMLEVTEGYVPRRLSIIFIPPQAPETFFTIPVPYMKRDVENMVEFWMTNKDNF